MKFPLISEPIRLPLRHNGDCTLLGVTPDYTVYVEEIYGDDAKIAQHALALDGSLLASIDEGDAADGELRPLDLPPELIKSHSGWHTMALNFAGPRHRGLRAPERTLDLVRPLSVSEKMALVNQLQLDVLPPLLLGIAESYVLAETLISAPNLYFVCRRVRIAVALTEEGIRRRRTALRLRHAGVLSGAFLRARSRTGVVRSPRPSYRNAAAPPDGLLVGQGSPVHRRRRRGRSL